MDYLDISNINLYKSFKKAPYTVQTAIVELIQNSINIFKQNNNLNQKSIIVVYFDLDNNRLQIMDNSNGINQNENLNHLWLSFDSYKTFNHHLISASFFLGSKVTIESKDGKRAFISELDIMHEKQTNTKIDFYSNEEILRIFNTGNRITISNLYHNFDLNNAYNFYKYLSYIFKEVINKNEISIIFSLVQNGLFIDPSTNQYQRLNNIASVNKLKFKLPEINNLKTISYENEILDVNKQLLHFSFNAYQFLVNKDLLGISFSNHQHIYLENNTLLLPDWFKEDYHSVYVDLVIDNLPLDLFHSKIMLSPVDLEKIISIIKQKIEPLKTEFPKTFTRPLIDSNDEKYHTKSLKLEPFDSEQELKNSQVYLTKIFNQTGKMNTIGDFEIVKDKLHFTYNADDGKKITMNLIKSKNNANQHFEWLQLIPINENSLNQTYEYDLKINLNHPYFKDFSQDPQTIHKLEHFIVCYAIAECITRLDGSDVRQLKYEINKLLWGNENDLS